VRAAASALLLCALAVAVEAAAPPPAAAQGDGAAQGDRAPLRLHRLPAPPPAPPVQWLDRPVATLRGLDKSSGRTETFDVAVGASAAFGRLAVTVNACRVPPPGEGEDAVAHLTVTDRMGGAGPAFSGWMFASAPALSALDHPRYDVWAIACRTASGSSS
jgi:hypothetical protein